MEISILELQHVLEVYLSSPLFLFYKESESPNEGSNFDMNKRREMGMVKKLRLVTNTRRERDTRNESEFIAH